MVPSITRMAKGPSSSRGFAKGLGLQMVFTKGLGLQMVFAKGLGFHHLLELWRIEKRKEEMRNRRKKRRN